MIELYHEKYKYVQFFVRHCPKLNSYHILIGKFVKKKLIKALLGVSRGILQYNIGKLSLRPIITGQKF